MSGITSMKRSTDSQLTEKTESASLKKVAASSSDKSTSTLTKAELTELLYEQVGLNKREAKEMVETFFEEICSALERGEMVKLSGFGNFQLRDKPQRPGRNPRTGPTFTCCYTWRFSFLIQQFGYSLIPAFHSFSSATAC